MNVYLLKLKIIDEDLYYIGKQETNYKKYIGSGKLLKRYLKKYGKSIIDNKTIIFESDNKDEIRAYERMSIAMFNAVKRDNFLNLAEGGEGGNTWAYFSDAKKQSIINKRNKLYVANPDIIKNSHKKRLKTLSEPTCRQNWLTNLRNAQPQKTKTRMINWAKKTDEELNELSNKKSKIMKNYFKNEPIFLKEQRVNNFKLTYHNRSAEQKLLERERKSIASKQAAKNRTDEEWKVYKEKVSQGVKKAKARVTSEQKQIRLDKYRRSMYERSKLYTFLDEMKSLCREKHNINAICNTLNMKYNINTSYIPVKNILTFYKII